MATRFVCPMVSVTALWRAEDISAAGNPPTLRRRVRACKACALPSNFRYLAALDFSFGYGMDEIRGWRLLLAGQCECKTALLKPHSFAAAI